MEKIVWKLETLGDEAKNLPRQIWTRKPPIQSSAIDPLLLLLLPAVAQTSETADLKLDISTIGKDDCAGLWFGSPFFSVTSFNVAKGVDEKCWVSNFPPVSYQDPEFLDQLIDVGLGPEWELNNLNMLHDTGYKLLYAVPVSDSLNRMAEIVPDACLLIIRTREELELVRLGVANEIREIRKDMPIALLGLQNRMPRHPEELGIDAIVKQPV